MTACTAICIFCPTGQTSSEDRTDCIPCELDVICIITRYHCVRTLEGKETGCGACALRPTALGASATAVPPSSATTRQKPRTTTAVYIVRSMHSMCWGSTTLM